MNEEQSVFQKFVNLLNTSSQTLMLIALVGLFAMPIVIAKNLEPMVRDSSEIIKAPVAVEYRDSATAKADPVVTATTNPNVLGVTTRTLKNEVTDQLLDSKVFASKSTSFDGNRYTTVLRADKTFKKTSVVKLKNTSNAIQTYIVNVVVDGNVKAASNLNKVVYIDAKIYKISSTDLPVTLELNGGQEVTIALESLKTSPSNLTLTIER